jgi:phage gp36-like protein
LIMYLTAAEITSHLYGEVSNEISRNNAALLQDSINAAVAEARGYLTAYDLTAIFSATGDNRNPILLLYIKDISVWHFIQLANPGVDLVLRQDRYEKAIKWLDKVQRGQTNPDLPLPTAPVDETSGSVQNFLKWGSNPKRQNNY